MGGPTCDANSQGSDLAENCMGTPTDIHGVSRNAFGKVSWIKDNIIDKIIALYY